MAESHVAVIDGQPWIYFKNTRRKRAMQTACATCGDLFWHRAVKARVCCSRLCASRRPKKSGRRMKNGYVLVWVPADSPHRVKSEPYVSEHRLVMAEHLGRPLLPSEEVHHRNGTRDDNRLENLELWASNHPAGQRVEDLLEWAHHLIALYE